MKTLKLFPLVLLLSVAVYAQHGHGPGGAPGGAPMGGPGTGASMGSSSSGMGAGNSGRATGRPTDMGSSAQNMGKQSPSDVLSHNAKLSSNLDKLLPNGMTAQQACDGFKNLGQCVAAIHVANNLNIPFADLKAKMTGSGAESLGKAIQDLKPSVNAKAEAKKANKQAAKDLSES